MLGNPNLEPPLESPEGLSCGISLYTIENGIINLRARQELARIFM